MILTSFFFTVFWYYTSSRNAVATQKLVQELSKHASSQTLDPNNNHPFDLKSCRVVDMVTLTALQLLVGLCISLAVHCMLSRTCSAHGHKIERNEDMIEDASTCSFPAASVIMMMRKGDIKIFAVGMLHLLGSFCANMGFALGSASIVQVVKLLEPIETLLLMALFNVFILNKRHGVTFTKFLSVCTVVLGTSMLLRSKGIGQPLHFQAALFALCSGFAMASRNVIKSKSVFVVTSRKMPIPTNQNGHVSSHFKVAATNGIADFSTITAVAAIPACIGLILVEIERLPST
jgi:drug/metabolite transporter (DMT)-like permease